MTDKQEREMQLREIDLRRALLEALFPAGRRDRAGRYIGFTGMICAGDEVRHLWEIERRCPIMEFVDVHRYLLIQELHYVMLPARQTYLILQGLLGVRCPARLPAVSGALCRRAC
jgi:hypothetical protein